MNPSMTKSIHPELVIAQVKRIVESEKRSEIHSNANGGNSILVVCPPEHEHLFIQQIRILMDDNDYCIIDINEALVSFVEENLSDIETLFEVLKGSIPQIFKAPSEELRIDLFGNLLKAIAHAFELGRIPVLIHTGALYGSGIDSIHLMESPLVMGAKRPLVILYPATQDGGQLLFLNTRPASEYRCMIVK